jgi:hypothetical protein
MNPSAPKKPSDCGISLPSLKPSRLLFCPFLQPFIHCLSNCTRSRASLLVLQEEDFFRSHLGNWVSPTSRCVLYLNFHDQSNPMCRGQVLLIYISNWFISPVVDMFKGVKCGHLSMVPPVATTNNKDKLASTFEHIYDGRDSQLEIKEDLLLLSISARQSVTSFIYVSII